MDLFDLIFSSLPFIICLPFFIIMGIIIIQHWKESWKKDSSFKYKLFLKLFIFFIIIPGSLYLLADYSAKEQAKERERIDRRVAELMESTPSISSYEPSNHSDEELVNEENTENENVAVDYKERQKWIDALKKQKGILLRAIDGNILEVEMNDGQVYQVKLINCYLEGINSEYPLIRQRSQDAVDYNNEVYSGGAVYLEKDVEDKDSKGRLLRYVWLLPPDAFSRDDIDVRMKVLNSLMIARGYCSFDNDKVNNKYNDILKKVVEESGGLFSYLNTPDDEEDSEDQIDSSSEERIINPSINQSYVADTTQGVIKGNRKSKIYHMPGQQDYNNISVKNVVFFQTEEDAINAGYRKALR